MESAGGEMERAHNRAMADLGPATQHQCLLDAFPDVGLRHLFLVAGCTGISEKGGTSTSEFYEGQCTLMHTVRELGLQVLYALLEAVAEAKGDNTGSIISVSDVKNALTSMGMESEIDVDEETVIFSCPAADVLVKRAKRPSASQAEDEEEERLIHANRGRDVMYRRMVRSAADILRNIHVPLGGSGERQESQQKRLAALYQSQAWRDLVPCLFLPRTIFEKLIPPVFHSIAGHFPRLSPGAKSLIQYTCEEALLTVIRSAWQALRHYGHRKVIACEDVCVMARILEPVMSALQARIPSELKRALDAEEERCIGRRREPSAKSSSTPGRSRSRDSRRTPSREPPKRRRGSAR